MAMKRVSDEELLRAVAELCDTDGVATFRGVGQRVGLRSTSSVFKRMKELEAQGKVRLGSHIRLAPGAYSPVVTPNEIVLTLRRVGEEWTVAELRATAP